MLGFVADECELDLATFRQLPSLRDGVVDCAPAPVYVSTAAQIGLLPTPGIPDLPHSLLPDDGSCRPPASLPPAVAAATATAVGGGCDAYGVRRVVLPLERLAARPAGACGETGRSPPRAPGERGALSRAEAAVTCDAPGAQRVASLPPQRRAARGGGGGGRAEPQPKQLLASSKDLLEKISALVVDPAADGGGASAIAMEEDGEEEEEPGVERRGARRGGR